ncbi:ribose-phosphate pyrophosphokinase [bacterium]|nr:MAG: ribose-phosphate pyrophosphokinase [bacterium]MBV6517383.1 Ribose-phosphate pyrophosphokinase [Planctomycetota bacterium]NUO15957.1 ribose-phosphate pyrophosphokinase [Planctomycetaceae bacterium]MCQ3951392.1 ribose-phosphate diphosphokinase [Planctomycetota bacterium]RIK63208.1 MAG: ribose-phosphate diphosphokinase [Planctomycetota bacterium]
MARSKGLKVFAGNSNPALAKAICDALEMPLGNARIEKFPDGEIDVKIYDDVRGVDCFFIQSTCPPVNDNLIEMLLFGDAARRASAERITAVIPYYGYARKDRKDEGRVPISAKLVANCIGVSGYDRVLTMDLHSAQIQGFFDIPVDHLYAAPVLFEYFRDLKKRLETRNITIVAPDVGRSKVARGYAKRLNAGLAIVDKRRVSGEETEFLDMIGNVEGQVCVIIDDMIATGGSIVDAAKACKKFGAGEIYVACTHPVMCGPAVERLSNAPLQECVVCDTIPTQGKEFPQLKVLSVAGLLAEAIKRIHFSESVSLLFK